MKNNKKISTKKYKVKNLLTKHHVLLVLLITSLIFFTACSKPTSNIDKPNKDSDNIQDGEDIKINDDSEKDNNDDNNKDDVIDEPEDDDTEVVETFLDENNIVTNQDSIEVVVNKERNLSDDYVPEDLVKITDVPTCLENPEINQLRKSAADALTTMFETAMDEIKIQLYARSGYRSYDTQVSLYSGYVSNHGKEAADKFSAKPGQSEHQTGLAMDITSDSVNLQLTEDFGDTEEGKWISENAYRFGFIVRYQKGKEDITGYMYEPWHVRYVGEDLAKKVYESGLTLEEYLFEE